MVMGKSTYKSSESEFTTATALFDLLMAFLPLPALLPFVGVLCADATLSFLPLGSTGVYEDTFTDLDLILGLPVLDVGIMGLSAI